MALSSGGPKGQRGRRMAEKHRIAVVGLGMALKPHLQSLRELSGRVEIAACYTPSEERREAFGRDNPDLSITDSLERVLADRSIRSVVFLPPPASTCSSKSRSRSRSSAGGKRSRRWRRPAFASASCCSTVFAPPRGGSTR